MSTSSTETGPRLPTEKFLGRFHDLHKAAMEENLETANSRSNARRFLLECLRVHSNHWYCYRYLNLSIETDLKKKLDAFKPVDRFDLYKMDIHDLKLLRRVAFQRYAFDLANEIGIRLLDQDKEKRVSRLWLDKDRALPRVPLALAVGYGVVLVAFKDWLIALGANLWFTAVLSIVALGLTWFLIYCNVRDRIGNVAEVRRRTSIVFRRCLIWSAGLLGTGRWLATYHDGLKNAFDWGVAISLGVSALFVAIVVQFFFTKSGSIADPL